MSGQGDCSRAFTMDLSNGDFRAMILCDFLGGKFYQECSSSLTIRVEDKSPAKSTVTKINGTENFSLDDRRWKTTIVVVAR